MATAMELLGSHFCQVHGVGTGSILEVSWVNGRELLQGDRIDLIPKIQYIESISSASVDAAWASTQYESALSAFTAGKFIEGGQPQKNSFAKYIDAFRRIDGSIAANGIDDRRSVIPVALDGDRRVILDGSHRVAAAIVRDTPVPVTSIDVAPPLWSPDYFIDRGVSRNDVESWLRNAVSLGMPASAVIVWPNGQGHLPTDEVRSAAKAFGLRPIYSSRLRINRDTLRSFVTMVYQGHRWLGESKEAYPGAVNQTDKVGRGSRHLTVHLFCGSGDLFARTTALKQHLRHRDPDGQTRLDSADDLEEVRVIADHALGETNRHFLANGHPYRYGAFIQSLSVARERIHICGAEPRNIALVGSAPLGIYGYRRPKDIDFVSLADVDSLEVARITGFDSHELHFKDSYSVGKYTLARDGSQHFCIMDSRVISLPVLSRSNSLWEERTKAQDMRLIESMQDGVIPGYSMALLRFRFSRAYALVLRSVRMSIQATVAFLEEHVSVPGWLRSLARRPYIGLMRWLK